jgi:hypothetical protein
MTALYRKKLIEVTLPLEAINREPRDVSAARCGYDVESTVAGGGRLRVIELKRRLQGAKTVTITENEILAALNRPEDFILAIVEVNSIGDGVLRYVRRSFKREPDFGATSVNYDLQELLARAEEPS